VITDSPYLDEKAKPVVKQGRKVMGLEKRALSSSPDRHNFSGDHTFSSDFILVPFYMK